MSASGEDENPESGRAQTYLWDLSHRILVLESLAAPLWSGLESASFHLAELHVDVGVDEVGSHAVTVLA